VKQSILRLVANGSLLSALVHDTHPVKSRTQNVGRYTGLAHGAIEKVMGGSIRAFGPTSRHDLSVGVRRR
jgi:hypothetical protein